MVAILNIVFLMPIKVRLFQLVSQSDRLMAEAFEMWIWEEYR